MFKNRQSPQKKSHWARFWAIFSHSHFFLTSYHSNTWRKDTLTRRKLPIRPHHPEVRIVSVSYCDNSNKKSKKSCKRKDTEENGTPRTKRIRKESNGNDETLFTNYNFFREKINLKFFDYHKSPLCVQINDV